MQNRRVFCIHKFTTPTRSEINLTLIATCLCASACSREYSPRVSADTRARVHKYIEVKTECERPLSPYLSLARMRESGGLRQKKLMLYKKNPSIIARDKHRFIYKFSLIYIGYKLLSRGTLMPIRKLSNKKLKVDFMFVKI